MLPNLPTDVMLQILGLALRPRLLPIKSMPNGELQLDPSSERISSFALTNQAMRDEVLRSHRIALGSILKQPVLYNRDTDILLFSVQASFTAPLNIAQVRDERVRFVAFEIASLPYAARSHNFDETYVLEVAITISVLGSVEKAFILGDSSWPDQGSLEECLREVKKGLEERYTLAESAWRLSEFYGQPPDRWTFPEIVVVLNREDDLLMKLSGL